MNQEVIQSKIYSCDFVKSQKSVNQVELNKIYDCTILTTHYHKLRYGDTDSDDGIDHFYSSVLSGVKHNTLSQKN